MPGVLKSENHCYNLPLEIPVQKKGIPIILCRSINEKKRKSGKLVLNVRVPCNSEN